MQNLINKENKKKIDLIKVVSLLIHAAKIDEKYTEKEKKLIKEFILKFSNNSNENVTENNILDILNKAEDFEKNSNQILEFTKEVKNMDTNSKIKIIENLWRIIYSNNEADVYETSLMRRLAGLLYVDNITMGDIKNKIKKEYSQ